MRLSVVKCPNARSTVRWSRAYIILRRGHHATERFGIQALGRHLAREFDLVHHFVDITNPV